MVLASFVYGLWEPDGNIIRYVGFSRDPKRRLRDHLTVSSDKSNTRRRNWLRSLVARGERPVMRVLEASTTERVADAERAWIEYLRDVEGCDLVNLTDGGDGNYGWVMPDEVKAKIGEKAKGRKVSPEARAKMSASRKGRSATWNIGRSMTVVAIEKRNANPTFHRTAHDPERMARAMAGGFGGPKSEVTKTRMRAAWTDERRVHQAERMRAVQACRWPARKTEAV